MPRPPLPARSQTIANLAFKRDRHSQYPNASASFTSPYDKPERAIDGKVSYTDQPNTRWTAFMTPNPTDWLAIDFGEPKLFSRIGLAIYADGGGVFPPSKCVIEYFDGAAWRPVTNAVATPGVPTAKTINEVKFDRVTAAKVRAVFTHSKQGGCGVTEFYVWE